VVNDPARPKKIPVSVLVVIHTADLQILLLERNSQAGFWQSVTGSQEAGETLPETACREVWEETGIRIAPDRLTDWKIASRYEIFHQWRHRYADGVTHNVEHFFSVCVPRDVVVTHCADEHCNARWLPWREAAEACFSWSNRDAIYLLAQECGQVSRNSSAR
jgi:dihydroneopterin triphosphate diphosphatase